MADNELPPRDANVRLANEKAIAESIARRDEALAFVAMQNAPQDQQALASLAQDTVSTADATRRQADEIASRAAIVDPEGTAPTLSDRAGNFAATIEVAGTGGTGVEASNSTAGGEQATSPEAVDLNPVGSGITAGDQPIGDVETDAKDDAGTATIDQALEAAQEPVNRGRKPASEK